MNMNQSQRRPGAEELEDYLELQDPEARAAIAASNADIAAGRTRPAQDLLQSGARGKKAPSTKR